MAVRKLLERLLHIVSESGDYFVSGSLSFLPLVEPYREPAHDVDASMSVTLFESRRDVIAAQGRIQVLRLGEVAVAQDSRASRVLSPRTDFIHVNTPDGLLDLTVYRIARNSLVIRLGAGLTLEVPRYVLDRIQALTWEGISYRAGPIRISSIPKRPFRVCNRVKTDHFHVFPVTQRSVRRLYSML